MTISNVLLHLLSPESAGKQTRGTQMSLFASPRLLWECGLEQGTAGHRDFPPAIRHWGHTPAARPGVETVSLGP